jgi:hypothetical protein
MSQSNPRPEPLKLLSEALDMDAEAVEILAETAIQHPYEVLPEDRAPPYSYEGRAHRYLSGSGVRVWNAIRMMRILCNEVAWYVAKFAIDAMPVRPAGDALNATLARHVDADGRLDTAAIQRAARANNEDIVRDILATVPYLLRNDATQVSLSARFLIWPLSVVCASVRLAPPAARKAALRFLYEIGEAGHIPQAREAARCIEEGKDTEDW